MAATTHTVVKGDTLTAIATRYGTTVASIADLNGITNTDLIYVGQVLTVKIEPGDVSPNNSIATKNQAVIRHFGLQANTDTTVFATWNWSKSDKTSKYRKVWDYYVGGYWFSGSDEESNGPESIYNAPSNATHVRFRVIPISKTYKNSKGKTASYFTAEWSNYEVYAFADNPPKQPSAPDVEIDGFKLTATLDNLDVNADEIEFQVIKDNSSVFTSGRSTIVTNHASFSCTIKAGSQYKVRCRSHRDGLTSKWSEYTQNYGTIPTSPSGITICRAESDTSVYLEWAEVVNATSYDVEYSTKIEYFDNSTETSTENDIKFPHFIFTGLESGQEYFFRVRATNTDGESSWSDIKSVVIGKVPISPTTWSSTTTAIVGEEVTLYWAHNAEDNSAQTYAEVELYENGKKVSYTVRTDDQEDDEKTMYFVVETKKYIEGMKLEWRVRTAGVTKEYGEWSIMRTIDVYSPVTLELEVTDVDGRTLEVLESFPFYISAEAGPDTQTPISYHVAVTANEYYEDVDSFGNQMIVNPGDAIYSKHFDTSEDLVVEMSAGNINLKPNNSYTVTVTVAMNSGLTASASSTFNVAWTDTGYAPNAEIYIDEDRLTANIRPYVTDNNDELVSGVTLSVYRRNFDGSFTELATGIDNLAGTSITDPHPALDYARYRIVAKTEETGTIEYYDMPGYPIGEPGFVIQWDEENQKFDVNDEYDFSDPPWSGTMLKLPYNIRFSESNQPDVSLVKYIGRKHPVGYYGTQLGMTATGETAIPRTDTETLYLLRCLQHWQGDCYMREPNGSGYWANITVSFNRSYDNLIIPITLNITRVEGGA